MRSILVYATCLTGESLIKLRTTLDHTRAVSGNWALRQVNSIHDARILSSEHVAYVFPGAADAVTAYKALSMKCVLYVWNGASLHKCADLQEFENIVLGMRSRNEPAPDDATAAKEVGQVRTEDILTERGKQYGAFTDHARITQLLKGTVYQHAEKKCVSLSASQREALDMILHKIGRIVNGNPNHTDSWDDIAGYAKLEADIQRGVIR